MLSREDLLGTAALTIDDALRQVPGFSLFRRSGSRVANPTAQGASLRGVGASGASRALVLLDGIPLNDPFGGWVYWSRIPRAAVERIEVLEGAASDLYGSGALAGVLQAIERREKPALSVESSAGNAGTAALSLHAGVGGRGPWGLWLAGERCESDGYVLVADDERGPVDTPAGGRHSNAALTIERRISASARAFASVWAFDESRKNGTPLQVNDTELQGASAGADLSSRRLGTLSLRSWVSDQVYRQAFSAVAGDRASERLTRRQRVPAEAAGLSVQWSRAAGPRHVLLAGLEGRRVTGRSDETIFAQGAKDSRVSSGGREQTWSLFAGYGLPLGTRTVLSLGARLDRWSEEDGSITTERFPDRRQTAVSPRAALLYNATPRLRFSLAGYGAFRAPTLNELYRSFRVGDVVTLANPTLNEERLWGGETGLLWSRSNDRLRLRAVAFVASIGDPVANVTLGMTGEVTTRQRQNLGRTRSQGLELDGEAFVARHFRLGFGYALIDATVRSFAADPELVGKRVPQVPRHQLSLQARYQGARFLDAAAQLRASSSQFEDDQNRLSLGDSLSLDLLLSRRLSRALSIFAAVENVSGERYAVGLTPVRTLGPPRLVRVGLRGDWNRGSAR